MPVYGKPNATGRSSGKPNGRIGKLRRPPKGEPWVWLTRELLLSDAYQSLGITARRFIDFLFIEHMSQGGCENGKLTAPYDQLAAFGCSRRLIKSAIQETVEAGLVEVTHQGGRFQGEKIPSRYRITFYHSLAGEPPTNEWKKLSKEAIMKQRKKRRARDDLKRSYKKNSGS